MTYHEAAEHFKSIHEENVRLKEENQQLKKRIEELEKKESARL